jgi:hypothetical protein
MIKGMAPQLAEAGKIKIGGLGEARKTKAGGTFRMPVKYDHFVITRTERDPDGDLIIDAHALAGCPQDGDGKVRAIPVIVHSDDIEEFFPTRLALYSGKKLACSGDGEQATCYSFKGQKPGETKEMACPCDYLGGEGKHRCKPNGKLICSLNLPGRAVAGAVHVWRTTSEISIKRMMGSVQAIVATVGAIQGLPLWLKVEPVKTENGTVYCCHLELRARDLVEARRMALEARQARDQLGGRLPIVDQQLIAPPASQDEPIEEQGEVAEEFYPPDATEDAELVEPESNGTNEKLRQLVGAEEQEDEIPDFGGPE